MQYPKFQEAVQTFICDDDQNRRRRARVLSIDFSEPGYVDKKTDEVIELAIECKEKKPIANI